jgi:hypothetical protein
MSAPIRVVFLVGGATVHPVAQQAGAAAGWLWARFGDRVDARLLDGVSAFEALDGCDLLVIMGLHWSRMEEVDWAGHRPYRPPLEQHRAALRAFVDGGRPVFLHHSAIGCYDDWTGYAELVGVRWDWDSSSHEPVARQRIHLVPTGHPVLDGVVDFEIVDEAYEDIVIAPWLRDAIHAEALLPTGRQPMVIASEVEREGGGGRIAYIALGHDLRAFRTAAYRRLWTNTAAWLLRT